MNALKNKIIFLLLGAVVFSPLSSLISFNYFHFPISLPELLFLPFCFLLRKKFRSFTLNKSSLFFILYFIIFLILVSLAIGNYSLYAILGNARVWILLFLSYLGFVNDNDFTIDDIMYLSFGSIVGWAYVSFKGFQSSIGMSDSTITYGLLLSFPIFLSLTYNRKLYLMLIGIVLMLVIFVFSSIRRVLVVFACSLIIIILLSFFSKKRFLERRKLFFIPLIFLTYCLIKLYPLVREFISNSSPDLYNRVFLRTEKFLRGGITASDDNVRFENITQTWEIVEKSLFPRGFISTQTSTDVGVGIYNDFPLTQLLYVFSIWGVIFIMYKFAKFLIRNISLYFKTLESEYLLTSSTLLIMIVLLFLEGTFLTYPYATPITGMLIGISARNSKNYYQILKKHKL